VKPLDRSLLLWLEHSRSHLRLKAGAIVVRPVMNPSGGHETRNYTVLVDGVPHLHARVGPASDAAAPWARAYPILASRHPVPALLATVPEDVLGTGRSALIFEHAPGTVPPTGAARRLLGAVVAAADKLHADADLRRRLPAGDPLDCAARFRRVYGRRWAADLAAVSQKRELLPFVDGHRWEWLQEIAEEVLGAADRSPAFWEPANHLVHGDLHWGNVLADGMRFWMVDWEDLMPDGDPMLDLALLAAPFPNTLEAMTLTAAERARLSIHLKAVWVDQAIDTLADWLEASGEDAPIRRAARALSRARHEAAVARLRPRR
jgi:aminoglycoside phosphotransferase (APT) family kinase protein